MTVRTRTHEIVIVGAGPVGMTLLLGLRAAGIDAVAVDRGDGPTHYPKARIVSARSMELLRRLGVAEEVLKRSLAGDWTERVVVARTLAGRELLRVESPSGPGGGRTASPERRVLCTQDRVERILAARIAAVAPDSVRWRCEAVGVTQGPELASVTLRQRAGGGGDGDGGSGGGDSGAGRGGTDDSEPFTLAARYVVLADGCRGLGAGSAVPGAGSRRKMMPQVSFLIDADLRPVVADRPALISYLVGGRHPAQLLCVDGDREWIVATVPVGAATARDYPPERVAQVLSAVLGLPVDHDVIATAKAREIRLWDIGIRIADTFVAGRIIRAGDAAHELSPTGGMGMNLGLADVDALAWRLSAILRGWGAHRLILDYEAERRPIALRTSLWTRECFNTVALLSHAAAHGDDAADLEQAARGLAVYLDHPGLDVGPLLPPQEEPPGVLVDDGRPGSRAPHVRLADGTSTIELYGGDPVLLIGADDAEDSTEDSAGDSADDSADGGTGTAELAAAAAARIGAPLRIARLPAEALARHGVGGRGAVLVRPDGYVVWRTESTATWARPGERSCERSAGHGEFEDALRRLAGTGGGRAEQGV